MPSMRYEYLWGTHGRVYALVGLICEWRGTLAQAIRIRGNPNKVAVLQSVQLEGALITQLLVTVGGM